MQASTQTAPRSGLIPFGQFFFKYRDLLFPLVFFPFALGTRPREFLGDPRAELALETLGILLVCGGQGLRALVIGLDYIRRGGKNREIFAGRLVQGGIFAHSRNPLYVGNFLIVAGLVMIHNGPWMYLIVLPFFLFVYVSIVAAEEQYLSGQFGSEYDEYCRRVPRFLPRLRGLLETVRGMSFDWKRLVRKEYGTFFSTVTAVLVLLAWEKVSRDGFSNSRHEILLLAIAWCPFILAYLTARILKKHRALGVH